MDYARRRKALMEKLDGGALILATNPERTRSNDSEHRFRPSSDLLYLCGFPEPDAILVLLPGHPEHESVLFVRPRDRDMEIWNGHRFGPEGAVSTFGVDAAFPISELGVRLPDLLAGRDRLFYSLAVDPGLDAKVFAAIAALRATRRRPDRAPHAIVDPRPLLHRMRMTKDADELALMARAAEISAAAHVAAMRATRPGMNEYEIDALLDYEFRRHGASGPAYTSIVAGGANACILHYIENNQPLRDGELLLVDAACELDWYASDITRTWPVGRTFTPPQRDIYSLVLDAEIAGVERVVVGATNAEIQAATIRTLTSGLVDLGLLSGDVDGLIEREAYRRFYMHGVGHYLGLDVHDVGIYFVDDNVGEPLAAGAVMTVEPGIYVSPDDEEAPAAFRGIGVRVEDDVVVTAGGPRVLTGAVPKSIEAIEAIRAEALEGR